MKRSITRRLATLAVAASIPVFSLAVTSPAQAITAPAASAADWLSKQLTDGVAHNDQYSFDDYGLSLDFFFALDALDAKPSSAASIMDALEAHPDYYVGSGSSIYAGAVGKLATAVQLDGRDPNAFGGNNLISTAEDRVMTSGAEQGRASDSFDPSSPWGADYSNTIGQAWVVRALTLAHSPMATDVTNYLLKQQCDEGFFREAMEGTQCTSGGSSIDATAFAIQALAVAQDNGETGLADDIGDAVAWLSGKQASSGSFADSGAANTNSTGLVASVLADHGQTSRAQKAATWILKHQVTTGNAGTGPLKTEVGAIAYDAAALTAGKTAGIPVEQRDQWRRATAQAAIGINIALSKPAAPAAGSSSGSSGSGGTASLYYGDTATDPEPDEAEEVEELPAPEPTVAEGADDNAASASAASSSDRPSAGWLVAGAAGILILGTAGAAGIGRLRGGGAS